MKKSSKIQMSDDAFEIRLVKYFYTLQPFNYDIILVCNCFKLKFNCYLSEVILLKVQQANMIPMFINNNK